jgi:hypothetical protein
VSDAVASYKKLRRADPTSSAAAEARFERLGEDLLHRQVDAVRAVTVLQVNAALHPDSPRACLDLADALFHARRLKEARPLLAKAQGLFDRDERLTEFERTYFRWKLDRLKAFDAVGR